MGSADPTSANLYARLGIPPEATTSQINAAYRRLALALHPDSAQRGRGDPDALRLVIEAHQILVDPHERQRYDSERRPTAPAQSRSAPMDLCGVCRGAGTIARPCRVCDGSGYVLTHGSWLRTPILCPVCHNRGGCGIWYCGACNGTGRRSTLADRRASTPPSD